MSRIVRRGEIDLTALVFVFLEEKLGLSTDYCGAEEYNGYSTRYPEKGGRKRAHDRSRNVPKNTRVHLQFVPQYNYPDAAAPREKSGEKIRTVDGHFFLENTPVRRRRRRRRDV